MGKTGKTRIINTSSVTCKMGEIGDHFFELDPEHYRRFKAYPNSKLAILMFTAELARRVQGRAITVNAVDPGVVNTGRLLALNGTTLADVFFRPFINLRTRGDDGYTFGNFRRYVNVSGGFFRNKRQVGVPKAVLDAEACQKLWLQTEQLVAGLIGSKLKKGEN